MVKEKEKKERKKISGKNQEIGKEIPFNVDGT